MLTVRSLNFVLVSYEINGGKYSNMSGSQLDVSRFEVVQAMQSAAVGVVGLDLS